LDWEKDWEGLVLLARTGVSALEGRVDRPTEYMRIVV
jgi:hypothetical protein